MTSYILEIATSDFNTTKMAVEGGADRIELCANLAEGGVTASLGTIRQCREAFDVALYPIIRPRGGDFLYTAAEFNIMLQDVLLCKETGCDGIVVGILLENGAIDKKRISLLVEAAYPLGVTFHRAFDRCQDPFAAMEQLIELGCERILTSGQQATAPEGVEVITQLQTAADHRIIIMPGSGVRIDNIGTLARQTGCTEFHSSLRGKEKSRMQFVHPVFESTESYSNNWINPAEVREMRAQLTLPS
jgi:copper homeostasis protein